MLGIFRSFKLNTPKETEFINVIYKNLNFYIIKANGFKERREWMILLETTKNRLLLFLNYFRKPPD